MMSVHISEDKESGILQLCLDRSLEVLAEWEAGPLPDNLKPIIEGLIEHSFEAGKNEKAREVRNAIKSIMS